MAELSEIQVDDPEQTKENAARIISFKAMRCLFLGLSYALASKYPDAIALYDRAAVQLKQAKNHLQQCKNISTVITLCSCIVTHCIHRS